MGKDDLYLIKDLWQRIS